MIFTKDGTMLGVHVDDGIMTARKEDIMVLADR